MKSAVKPDGMNHLASDLFMFPALHEKWKMSRRLKKLRLLKLLKSVQFCTLALETPGFICVWTPCQAFKAIHEIQKRVNRCAGKSE